MLYESTRGGLKGISSAEAIKMGLAPDGGLFVPERIVKLDLEFIQKLVDLDYQQRAVEILKDYLDDFSLEEVKDCVCKAYTLDKFSSRDIAPMYKLNDYTFVLELWHGPTCAFKDIALQILPHMLVKSMYKTGEKDEIVILVATSGDTGKAALEGFKDVAGTQVIVFYPQEGVSEVQKMQMITQEGNNVHVVAVQGNFDDAQNGVKDIFSDLEFSGKLAQKGFKFSSANSINWGRLVPQIVYYFSAYCDLIKMGDIQLGEKINIAVPTGNFGNILAAYYALMMGLPIHRLICASNENNVLTDFLKNGVYNKNREFKKTVSPSMDILISSNLERLLYEISGRQATHVSFWMDRLKSDGEYLIDQDTRKKIQEIFWGGDTSDLETVKTIECVYKESDYLVDTHTAVGIDVYDKYVISTGDMTKTVIASTASPYKFNQSVASAVLGAEATEGISEFELLKILEEKTAVPIPEGLHNLESKAVRHQGICTKTTMKEEVAKILQL